MAVTETVKRGWGERLGASLRGVLPGLIMFIGAFPLLFWNEGSAVKIAKALDEGQGRVIEVESNSKIDAENDGQLVHMTGKADTKEVLQDPIFGISENCIRLERKVEIYQWVENAKEEKKKNLGGSETTVTTYTYSLEWNDEYVDSSRFKEPGHDNPPGGLEFKSESWQAENVSFGAFALSEYQIGKIKDGRIYSFPDSFTSKVARVQMGGDYIYVPEKATRMNPLNNRDVQSQTRPGDMRVKFRIVRPHNVSIIAKQRGESFVSYIAKSGGKVNMLRDGVMDSAEMFEDARSGNAIITWFFRIVGFFLMWVGLKKVLAIFSTLADVLPLLGDLIAVGTGFVAGVIAFAGSLITIAVAWVFFRPVLGITLLVLAGAGIFFLWKKRSAIGSGAKEIKEKLEDGQKA